MERISDEIRDRCDLYRNRPIYNCDLNKLHELADRIDSEMVELPKDKDGVPIHVRDTVFVKSGDGEEETVTSITLTGGTAAVTTACRGIKAGFRPEELTHERPDSLKRIADELDEMVDAADSADDSCEKLADFAERIRRLAEKEGDHGPF